ncbi:redoxin domain-containing protein [Spirosoma sp. HMF4905]|uniref:Redoxin domain-containing protein n=1 Tax=Spirosoma arboris TaxID=2682092 RepID=A0A7K1SA76_9BACT|nr:thioredoxin family protein [Spirosoma arboris]MVM30690.1 redoxin domain-containing protein [Spirosoma arboris]
MNNPVKTDKLVRFTLTALLILTALTAINAQPKGYTLGDVVADFRLKSVDGRTISLADYRSQKGLIVVFTSNHCPFAKAYENRLIALDRKFSAQGFPVLAIMPNDPTAYEEDSFGNMKARASDKNFPYAYTIDETQATARAFGATRTPEVYVLKQTNSQFILEYMGTIDDSPQDETSVQRRYIDEAVSSLLAGRPVQSPITKPIGCAIKWK